LELKVLKKIVSISSIFLLLSCTCGVPLRVTSIQRSDKKLTCKDIILEINESEQYRQEAGNAKGISIGEALAPVCWINGYIDGTQAVKAANARIDYLGHIYDLMDCGGNGEGKGKGKGDGDDDDDGKGKHANSTPLPATPPPPVVVPVKPAPPPSAPIPVETSTDDSSAWAKGGTAPYFKELGGDLHAHIDAHGKIYVHSHQHSGPHRHLEDQ
jgi:hypothetical protein